MPRNTCIDLQNSSVPSEWITQQHQWHATVLAAEMDLLFSPQGGLIGPAGAKGIMHLHIADVGDAALNTLPGSPTTPTGEDRVGDELGITVFTRAGRVIVHPMDGFDLFRSDNMPGNPRDRGDARIHRTAI